MIASLIDHQPLQSSDGLYFLVFGLLLGSQRRRYGNEAMTHTK